MTEEALEEKEEEKEEEPQGPTDIEALAKEMGWNPDFKGLDREKVDARTYILRSREIQDTMRKQIKSQGGKIEALGDQLSSGFKRFEEFQGQVHKAKVSELKSEIAVLKKDRRAAVKEGDGELLDDLDEQIDALKVAANVPAPAPSAAPQAKPQPEFVEWKEKNPWYQGASESDKEMTMYTDNLYQDNMGLPLPRILIHIDKMMREHYPEKFPENTEEKEEIPVKEPFKVAPVEGGEKKKKAKTKFTRADLTERQKATMDEFVQMKVLTAEKYIEGLAIKGELS